MNKLTLITAALLLAASAANAHGWNNPGNFAAKARSHAAHASGFGGQLSGGALRYSDRPMPRPQSFGYSSSDSPVTSGFWVARGYSKARARRMASAHRRGYTSGTASTSQNWQTCSACHGDTPFRRNR